MPHFQRDISINNLIGEIQSTDVELLKSKFFTPTDIINAYPGNFLTIITIVENTKLTT